MLTPGNPPLWADKAVLAVAKPSGLRVIPDGYDAQLPNLHALLEAEWGRLWVVHRLDKDTSGVIVFARTPEAHRVLNAQFANRTVVKVYHALASGSPEWDHLLVDLPLLVNGDRSHRTICNLRHGKPAQTHLQIMRKMENFCLVEARPHSGYTHQIRAHLSSSGLPLLGDPLYQYPPSWKGARVHPSLLPPFPRTALHALEIHLTHPESGQPLDLLAPYPDDFTFLLS